MCICDCVCVGGGVSSACSPIPAIPANPTGSDYCCCCSLLRASAALRATFSSKLTRYCTLPISCSARLHATLLAVCTAVTCSVIFVMRSSNYFTNYATFDSYILFWASFYLSYSQHVSTSVTRLVKVLSTSVGTSARIRCYYCYCACTVCACYCYNYNIACSNCCTLAPSHLNFNCNYSTNYVS